MRKICLVIFVSVFLLGGFHIDNAICEDNYEIVFWQSIKDSQDPSLFQLYLDKYPEGTFVGIARHNITKYGSDIVEPQHTTTTIVHQERQTVEANAARKVAIFPFRFLEDGDYMRSILTNDLVMVVNRYKCLELTHSFYQLDKGLNVQSLRKEGALQQTSFLEYMGVDSKKIWDGGTPNAQKISEIGREVGADTVLIGAIRVSNPWSDKYVLGYIRIYVIDVDAQKIVKATNRTMMDNASEVLQGIIERAVKQYTKLYCEG